MDEAVMAGPRMMPPVMLRLVLPAMLLGAALSGAHAQVLQDPTRPPAAAAVGAADAATALADAGPRLQTILVAREAGGRHLAVIDGQTVRPGDTVRGARVARIGDNEVTLVRGTERQVLRLYAQDAAGMTPARPAARRRTE